MAKNPQPTVRTAPMPDMRAPARGTVMPIDPPQPSNQGAVDEAMAGSEVQNAPSDADRAAALDTPEGKQAARDAEAAADEAATQAAKDASLQQQKIIANSKQEPLSPANAYPGQSTATMVSPREFFVLLQDGRRVQFKKGPQEVCEGLQEHQYVKAHGVELYDKA